MKLSVIGPPGSGKSTQAQFLSQKISLPHIYMGEVLRKAIEAKTLLGEKARPAVEKGELVDDDLVLELFFERVGQGDCRQGFISDGVPRTLYQAEKIAERLIFDKVVLVAISLDIAKERLLKRGRMEDSEKVIENRFRVFEAQTMPILDFYRKQGKLVEVDGAGTVEEVAEEILAVLGQSGNGNQS